MTKEIAVDEFLVEMGGYDLVEQLTVWLAENEWDGDQVRVSYALDSDSAIVELEFSPFDDLSTRNILAYSMTCGLSEDFELVSRRAVKGSDGRTAAILFTVRSL